MKNQTYSDIFRKLKYCLENDKKLFWQKNWNTEFDRDWETIF